MNFELLDGSDFSYEFLDRNGYDDNGGGNYEC